MLTEKALKKWLSYNEETGIFTWLHSPSSQVPAGSIAGYKTKRGYIQLGLGGKLYYAHQLVWLYMTGKWPTKTIDHIDQDKTNNKFANLRHVSRSINYRNSAASKKESHGVFYMRDRNKYKVQFTINGKTKYCGIFPTYEEACQHAVKAKQSLFPAA